MLIVMVRSKYYRIVNAGQIIQEQLLKQILQQILPNFVLRKLHLNLKT